VLLEFDADWSMLPISAPAAMVKLVASTARTPTEALAPTAPEDTLAPFPLRVGPVAVSPVTEAIEVPVFSTSALVLVADWSIDPTSGAW
jgi:hypothetical protein